MYPPIFGAMRPENMPGYREPKIRTDLTQGDSVAPATTVASCWVNPAIAPLLALNTVGGGERTRVLLADNPHVDGIPVIIGAGITASCQI